MARTWKVREDEKVAELVTKLEERGTVLVPREGLLLERVNRRLLSKGYGNRITMTNSSTGVYVTFRQMSR